MAKKRNTGAGTIGLMRPALLTGLALLLLAAWPAPAAADITAFLGTSPTPARHDVKGGAFGIGLVIVGLEIEVASTAANDATGAPALKTGMGNVLVQTPTHGWQVYGTAGGGLFHETYRDRGTTSVGTNIGGGIKFRLAGPIKVRLDYRVFHLSGDPLYKNPQRFYVGLNLSF